MLGVFDSGIGGLTTVKALRARLPELPIIYLADTARAPFGPKGSEAIRRYSEEAARFLVTQGAKAMIIACNTASSLATDHVRAAFPGLPVFEVVTPAVERAVSMTRKKRIGVIGTRATIGSGIYERRLKQLDPEIEVFSNAAPLLVSLVEEGWHAEPETVSIVGKYLEPLIQADVDTLILGCTHYPLLKPLIAEAMGAGLPAGRQVKLIDSAEAVAAAFCATLEDDLPFGREIMDGTASFHATDPNPTFVRVASEWLGQRIEVLRAEL